MSGILSIYLRLAFACSEICTNSLLRWLSSMTLMPVPRQLSISQLASLSTSFGRQPGPDMKLNTFLPLSFCGRPYEKSHIGVACAARRLDSGSVAYRVGESSTTPLVIVISLVIGFFGY